MPKYFDPDPADLTPNIAIGLKRAANIAHAMRWEKKERCLNYAWAAHVGLTSVGERPVIQAGTCYWPVVEGWDNPDVKDAVIGWEFDPDGDDWQAIVRNNKMPEMHAWIALPERELVIDMSVKHFPEIVDSLTPGRQWEEIFPRDGVAVLNVRKLHRYPGVDYQANQMATAIAYVLTMNAMEDFYEADPTMYAIMFERSFSMRNRRGRETKLQNVGGPACPVRIMAKLFGQVEVPIEKRHTFTKKTAGLPL